MFSPNWKIYPVQCFTKNLKFNELISDALAADINAKSIVNFNVNHFNDRFLPHSDVKKSIDSVVLAHGNSLNWILIGDEKSFTFLSVHLLYVNQAQLKNYSRTHVIQILKGFKICSNYTSFRIIAVQIILAKFWEKNRQGMFLHNVEYRTG